MKFVEQVKAQSMLIKFIPVIMVKSYVRFIYSGIGGVGVCSSLWTQKVAGSNPVVTNPERSGQRSQLLDESMQSLQVNSAE